MKKILLALSLLTTSIMSIMAQSATINVETAGTLSTLLTNPMSIEELTITGNLNGTDLRLLREMAGSDYNGQVSNGKLRILDISEATIVAGGAYAEFPDGYIHLGNGQVDGSAPATPLYSEDNKLCQWAFAGCTSLEQIVLPKNLISIGYRLFSSCGHLKGLHIPQYVESIGGAVLSGCEQVESLTVDSHNQMYSSPEGSNAIVKGTTLVYGCKNTIIPNTIKEIGDWAFFGNSSGLTSLEIPSGVEIIGYQSFRNAGIVSIVLPQSLKTIKEYAFQGCSSLKTIDIPSSVTSINNGVFYNCTSLQSVNIPNSVTSIGSNAFAWCPLSEVTLPSTLKVIGGHAFSLTNISSITIPASVEEIGIRILNHCSNLTQIVVESGNKKFDSRDNCNAIIEKATNTLITGCKTSTIPKSVYSIGDYAFTECQALSTFTIPTYITSIGKYAFAYCRDCEFTVSYDSPIAVGENAFYYAKENNCVLKVPTGTKEKYKNFDGWKDFGDNIVEEGGVGTEFQVTLADGLPMWFTITGENTVKVGHFLGVYTNPAVDGNLFISNNGNKPAFSTITIPESVNYNNKTYSVTELGDYIFYNIRAKNIILPSSLLKIGTRTFAYCWDITELVIPQSVTSIRECAIVGCTSLTSLRMVANNKVYSSINNTIIEGGSKIIAAAKTAIIPEIVTEIGEQVFWQYSNMTLTIPSTIRKINNEAFRNCSNLTLQVEHTTPLVINEDVFYNLQNSTLRVPAGCKAAYASATGWKNFGTILEGNEGTTFTAKTAEGWEMVFSVLDEDTKTCQVGYFGDSWDKRAVDNGTVKGSLTIPEEVEGYTVVKIGKCSLNNIDGMTSVTIPNTVTAIDDYAFFSCDGLKSFELPASVTSLGTGALSAFWNATSIKVVKDNKIFDSRDNCNAIIETATNKIVAGCQTTTIPASIKEIGNLAFSLYSCTISIPSTVTKIDDVAFRCNNLTLQVEHTTPLVISENAFQAFNNQDFSNFILRVPAGSKAAYASATGWKNFGTIYEGNEGTTFTAKTAEGWDMIFTILDETAKTCQVGYLDGSRDKRAVDKDAINGPVTIPEIVNGYTVIKIGKYALYNIYKMTSITIPNTVTSIEDLAFWNCNGLTSLELPASVTSIGNHALTGFYNATSIKVAEGNKKYDSRGDCNAIIEKATNKILAGCNTTTIPATATEIGEYAFFNLSNYTLTIPSTITKIDDYAFYYNSNITLRVEHTIPPVINENVFQNLRNSTLRVPAGSKAAYASATGWKNFGSILEGNEGSTFTAKTAEGWDMVFTILDETAKTCQVGYLDGSWDKVPIDRDVVEGSVTIPETVNDYTVVKIGKYAFNNTSKIRSVTIPATVTSIEDYALWNCNGLTSFELPANVAHLGKASLVSLRSVTSLKVSEGNATYDSRGDCNAVIETATNKLLFGCNITMIPADVSEIGEYAFRNFSNYTLTLPSTITKIGNYAFSNCKNLTLEVEHTTPLVINENVFQNMQNSTLRVPAGSKAAYVSATGWKNFGEENIIEIEQEEFVLNKSELAIAKGESEVLTATCPSSWSNKKVTWKSSNTKVATVSSTGEVTGVKTGTATITCTSKATGQKATCEVTVGQVKLSKTEIGIQKGEKMTLKATVYPTTVDQSVTWESSDKKVATVSEAGEVTGVKTGTATITCISNATGLSATCEVTVGQVKLSKTEVTIQKGKAVTLKATVYPTTKDQSVTWKSSNTKIATVSEAGKVTGVKTGTATITCTSNATGMSATCEVTVGQVKLSKSEVSIQKSKTVTLKATVNPTTLEDQSVTWKSSDSKIATVSSTGKVTGVKTGTATITCTSNATGLSATCEVTVGQIKLSKTEVSIQKGKTVTLKATVYPTTKDQSVTWESSDPTIAKVSEAGKVKGVGAGTATITCTSNATGLSATCKVTVTATANSRSLGGGDDDVTGIDDMDVEPGIVEPFDVYDISGRKVRHQVTSLDGLPNGVYIVNGKKVLKKD